MRAILSYPGGRTTGNHTITDENALLIVSCAVAIHQQLYLVIGLLNEQARVLKRLVVK